MITTITTGYGITTISLVRCIITAMRPRVITTRAGMHMGTGVSMTSITAATTGIAVTGAGATAAMMAAVTGMADVTVVMTGAVTGTVAMGAVDAIATKKILKLGKLRQARNGLPFSLRA
jgi:hypothetical protein